MVCRPRTPLGVELYFPDLGNECQVDAGEQVRAVGWLDAAHSFPEGAVPAVFLKQLKHHLQSCRQPYACAGFHECAFCEGTRRATGSANLWIPSPGRRYVAPELVLHYIEAHAYKPPEVFIQAVLSCPPQGSQAYLALLEDRGHFWLDADRSCDGL